MRNSMATALSRGLENFSPGYPWVDHGEKIREVTARINRSGQNVTHGRVVAGLTFGFWATLVDKKYEELWRQSLRFAFRHSPGDRSTVAGYVKGLHQLRNRVAHHKSILAMDPVLELQKILELVSWISPEAGTWLSGIETVTVINGRRPVPPRLNTVIIPATDAWPLYEKVSAYICQADRTFRPVDHIAFYADQEIKSLIPKIESRHQGVAWGAKHVQALKQSGDPIDARLAQVMSVGLRMGWTASSYQVWLLSSPKSADTVNRVTAIPHRARGRGSAFVQGQRYALLGGLTSATDTRQLSSQRSA